MVGPFALCVTGRETISGLIEDLALQDTMCGKRSDIQVLASTSRLCTYLLEFGLDLLPNLSRDDGLMLAWVCFVFMSDVSLVDRIGQHVVDLSARQWRSSCLPPRLILPLL